MSAFKLTQMSSTFQVLAFLIPLFWCVNCLHENGIHNLEVSERLKRVEVTITKQQEEIEKQQDMLNHQQDIINEQQRKIVEQGQTIATLATKVKDIQHGHKYCAQKVAYLEKMFGSKTGEEQRQNSGLREELVSKNNATVHRGTFSITEENHLDKISNETHTLTEVSSHVSNPDSPADQHKTITKDLGLSGLASTIGQTLGGPILQWNNKVRSDERRQMPTSVAFTVYLDHLQTNVGTGQTIKFNQILINEGNGYNVHTGVFTCQTPGLYLFYFSIGVFNRDQVVRFYARLMKNSAAQVGAGASAWSSSEAQHGSNLAVVRLNAGDVVYVQDVSGTELLDIYYLHTSSFSGVLL